MRALLAILVLGSALVLGACSNKQDIGDANKTLAPGQAVKGTPQGGPGGKPGAPQPQTTTATP